MAMRTERGNQEGQAMKRLQNQVAKDAYAAGHGKTGKQLTRRWFPRTIKPATLLKYVITYLEVELEEPREAFDANDGLDIHTLVNDAIDAYNGGAR